MKLTKTYKIGTTIILVLAIMLVLPHSWFLSVTGRQFSRSVFGIFPYADNNVCGKSSSTITVFGHAYKFVKDGVNWNGNSPDIKFKVYKDNTYLFELKSSTNSKYDASPQTDWFSIHSLGGSYDPNYKTIGHWEVAMSLQLPIGCAVKNGDNYIVESISKEECMNKSGIMPFNIVIDGLEYKNKTVYGHMTVYNNYKSNIYVKPFVIVDTHKYYYNMSKIGIGTTVFNIKINNVNIDFNKEGILNSANVTIQPGAELYFDKSVFSPQDKIDHSCGDNERCHFFLSYCPDKVLAGEFKEDKSTKIIHECVVGSYNQDINKCVISSEDSSYVVNNSNVVISNSSNNYHDYVLPVKVEKLSLGTKDYIIILGSLLVLMFLWRGKSGKVQKF